MLSHECALVLSKFRNGEPFLLEDVERLVGNHDNALSVMYFLEKDDYALVASVGAPGSWYRVSELGRGYLEDKSMQRKTACYALIAAVASVISVILGFLALIL